MHTPSLSSAQLRGLAAAIKVALPTVLAACGGHVTQDSPATPDADAGAGGAPAAPSTTAAPKIPAPKDAPTVKPGYGLCGLPTITTDTPACCAAVLTVDETTGSVPEYAFPCCDAIAANPKAFEGPDTPTWGQKFGCCDHLGFGPSFCTPWGPPVPPEDASSPHAGRSTALLDLRGEAAARVLSFDVDPLLAAQARGTWLARMVNEHGSARVFEALSAQLAEAGFDREARECLEFAGEERKHGALCGAVVTALGGVAIAPALEALPMPEHAAVSRREAALRNVLSVACLSETVAVALVGAEWHEMPDGALRDVLGEIWADEIGHARFGYRLLRDALAGATDDERAGLAAYLPIAMRHLVEHELAHLPVATAVPEDGARVGLCDGESSRALLFQTIENAIVPGLAALGLPAQEALAAAA